MAETLDVRPAARTLLPERAAAQQGRRAGIVTRTVAMVVDTAVVAIVVAAAYLTWAGVRFLLHRRGFTWPSPGAEVTFGVAYLVAVLYLTASWSSTGRSVGKRLLGLRVVTGRGRRLGRAHALLRALACVTFPILLFWSAVSRANRSVQDVVLRTSVIYDWRSRPPEDGGAARPRSDDALGVRVDVAAAVAHEADHGEAEALPGVDGEG